MIDMVFLLLVFFLFAGTFVRANNPREVELAGSAQSQVPEDTAERITLTLEPDGSVFLGEQQLVPSALAKLLREAYADGLGLNLRAHRDTPFSEVRVVLKLAAEAGIHDIIFATHQLD